MAPVEPLPPNAPVVFLTILYTFFTFPEMGNISNASRPNAPFLDGDPGPLSIIGLRGDLEGDFGVAARALATSVPVSRNENESFSVKSMLTKDRMSNTM